MKANRSKNMIEKVIYNGKKLEAGTSDKQGMLVLWEGLPDNPEPYAEITREEYAKLPKVIENN